ARRRHDRARRSGPAGRKRSLRSRDLDPRGRDPSPRRGAGARPRPALALVRAGAALDRPADCPRGAARDGARARGPGCAPRPVLPPPRRRQRTPDRRLAPRARRPGRPAERCLRGCTRRGRRLPAGAAARPVAPAEREQEERWAVVRRPPPGARPARGEGGAAPTGDTPRGEGAAGRGAGEHPAERGGEAGAHQAAAGAGTGTDPHLLGEASAERAARERFDLPLAARVRALGGGAAPPSSGEAPPPAPDARPDLAAAQRRDAPVLKMRVPPGYEAAVRAVFAHPGREAPP